MTSSWVFGHSNACRAILVSAGVVNGCLMWQLLCEGVDASCEERGPKLPTIPSEGKAKTALLSASSQCPGIITIPRQPVNGCLLHGRGLIAQVGTLTCPCQACIAGLRQESCLRTEGASQKLCQSHNPTARSDQCKDGFGAALGLKSVIAIYSGLTN